MRNQFTFAAGQTFKNVHMPDHSFEVLHVDVANNALGIKISLGATSWFETWNLEHAKWGMERKEYHSFKTAKIETVGSALIDDLYNHRNWLFINLAKEINKSIAKVWKSRKHSDGTSQPGWFVLGIGIDKNQITYHMPEDLWSACGFALELEISPWDGHSSADVIERLKLMAK